MSAEMYTYHCLCNELVIATPSPLPQLINRKGDGSSICKISVVETPIAGGAVLSSATALDDQAVVIELEDGFEKRYPLRCKRCDLQIGYCLDYCQFGNDQGRRDDVAYLLPDAVLNTEEMKAGRRSAPEQLAQEAS